jgi:hypothetical protein
MLVVQNDRAEVALKLLLEGDAIVEIDNLGCFPRSNPGRRRANAGVASPTVPSVAPTGLPRPARTWFLRRLSAS